MATSQGKLHDVFLSRTTELRTQAAASAAAARGDGQRQWNTPAPDDWDGNPLELADVTAAFARESITDNYEQALLGETEGTVGDAVSLKAQADWLGVMERAYRASRATPVRCIAHATARRKGHGHEKGIFTGGVLVFAQNALKAGQAE